MTLDYKKVSKLKVQDVMKDLPVKLKDPKCYKRIEKRIALAMYSDHKHANVKTFMKCKRCTAKVHRKREIITEEGFKSMEQYLGWKKIMDVIENQRSIMVSNKFVK
jgi:hypothetical protein